MSRFVDTFMDLNTQSVSYISETHERVMNLKRFRELVCFVASISIFVAACQMLTMKNMSDIYNVAIVYVKVIMNNSTSIRDFVSIFSTDHVLSHQVKSRVKNTYSLFQ